MTKNKLIHFTAMSALCAACLLSGSSVFAQANVNPQKSKPADLEKPFVTMDEKVAMANHIFIGAGRRIYFQDCLRKEVSYDSACSPSRYSVSAMLELEVIKTLYVDFPKSITTALIPINGAREPFGNQPSGYDSAVIRYMSGPALYFGKVQTDQIRVDVAEGPSKIVGEITLHRFIEPYAVDGPKANPLPLTYLKEAVDAINRRVEGEKRQATAASQKAKK